MGFDFFDIGKNILTLGGYGASKAAEAQKEGAEKGLAVQERMYTQQRKDFSPYQRIGYQGLGRLTGEDITYTDPVTGKEITVKGSGSPFAFGDEPGVSAPSYDTEYTARLKDYATSPAFEAQNRLAQQDLQRRLGASGKNYGGSAATAGSELTAKLTASDYDKYRGDLAQRYKALQGEYAQKRDVKQNEYNRLMDMVKVGQGASGTVSAGGSNYANQATTLYGNIGQAEAGYQSGMAAIPWKLAGLGTQAMGAGGGGGGGAGGMGSSPWFGGGGQPGGAGARGGGNAIY